MNKHLMFVVVDRGKLVGRDYRMDNRSIMVDSLFMVHELSDLMGIPTMLTVLMESGNVMLCNHWMMMGLVMSVGRFMVNWSCMVDWSCMMHCLCLVVSNDGIGVMNWCIMVDASASCMVRSCMMRA